MSRRLGTPTRGWVGGGQEMGHTLVSAGSMGSQGHLKTWPSQQLPDRPLGSAFTPPCVHVSDHISVAA